MKEQTPLQKFVYFFFSFLFFYTITASAVQFVTEMSPLLEFYNWLLSGMAVIGIITKLVCDNFDNYPSWVTWPFKFLFALSGIIGAYICYEYSEFVPEILNTFGSR